MSPTDWAIRPLKHYADFSGRSPRAEFWWFTLLILIGYMIAVLVLIFVDAGRSLESDADPFGWFVIAVLVIAGLGLFLPSLAVQVRRLHDQDMSGWWVLLFFIPYLGALIALVFMLIPGTKGSNRFGRDPYELAH